MSGPLPFDADVARRIEALYTSTGASRRRRWVLEHLAPQPGERVADIGCGPGFLAAELGAAVGPTGGVEAIDASPAMLALARARCAPLPWVAIHAGDAERLELEGQGFDAALSVQVHEYVRDAAGSLARLAPRLRPGGRALVVATDWDSIVWHASDPARMACVLSAFEEHLADLHLPRRLGPLLTAAGLTVERCEVLVQLDRTLDPGEAFSAGLLELVREFVPGRRGVTREDAEAWEADLRALDASGAYFFSLNQYLFLARRPG